MLSETDRAFLLNVAQIQGHQKAHAALEDEVERISYYAQEKNRCIAAARKEADKAFPKSIGKKTKRKRGRRAAK